MSPKGAIRILLISLALGAGTLTLTPAALAAGAFKFEKSFGTFPGTPRGAAVAQSTGDLFVAALSSVQVFTPTGEQSSFKGPLGSEFTPDDVAVDNSAGVNAGDVYVASEEDKDVYKCVPSGASYECHVQLTGFSSELTGVAVDANGNVYVSQAEGPVEEFNTAGGHIASLKTPERAFAIAVNATGSLLYVDTNNKQVYEVTIEPVAHEVIGVPKVINEEKPRAVTVDQATGTVFVAASGHVAEYEPGGTKGETFGAGHIGEEEAERGIAFSSHAAQERVYVIDAESPELGRAGVDEFLAAGAQPPKVTCSEPVEILRTSATLECAVEPQPAGEETSLTLEYRQATQATFTPVPEGTITSSQTLHPTITGLTPGTSYLGGEYIYRMNAKSNNGREATSNTVTFSLLPAVKGLSQCSAGLITGEGATLQGELEPQLAGELPATYHFDYGTSTAYGTSTTGSTLNNPGSAQAAAPVTGLNPNTAYDCRLAASDSYGETLGPPGGEFKTLPVPPKVDGHPPTILQSTRKAALLEGTLNPEHSPTTFYIAYIDATHYQASTPNPYAPGQHTPITNAGSGLGEQSTGPIMITGLRAETEYHYALIAENQAGITIGRDHLLTTAPRAPPTIENPQTNNTTQTATTITATINSRGQKTSYEIDLTYNTENTETTIPTYGTLAEEHETITLTLNNLTPNTTYHYTIHATNEDATTQTQTQTFTTQPTPPPPPQPPTPTLLPTPPTPFPTTPPPPPPPHPPTEAEKLAKALKACKHKPPKQRPACIKHAHKQHHTHTKH